MRGEATSSRDVLNYFSTDGSIFTITPQAVVYPRNTDDVVSVVRYLAAEAKAGRKTGLTARGKGTDQAGGALGDGVMMVFPAHMNRLLELTKRTVTVQPGLIYRDLQNTLHTHGRFLPPYPSSIDFCTLGGAVANNSAGEKTIKYGSTREFVEKLEVVLSNGQVIETRKLSPTELAHKKSQDDFEGQIYRDTDALIDRHKALIKTDAPKVSKNAAGYALGRVRSEDGSFDLSQLIVGSQGTLGIVTSATLKTEPFNPKTTLIVGYFDDLDKASKAVLQILPLGPSALEVVDFYLLDFLKKHRPAQIEGLVPDPLPKIVLLAEFDDPSQLQQRLKSARTQRIFKRFASSQLVSTNRRQEDELWNIRHSAAAVIWMVEGGDKALPIIEDGVVPVEKMSEFLTAVYKLFKKYKLEIAVWGHAGNANFHMQPFMDLSKLRDRTMVFDLADEFYNMVIKMGGSTCGEHNDGMMRAPYLAKLYGKEMYKLFQHTKQIFDPLNFLNPRVKIDVTEFDTRPLLRREYSMKHLYDHLPHT